MRDVRKSKGGVRQEKTELGEISQDTRKSKGELGNSRKAAIRRDASKSKGWSYIHCAQCEEILN
jgi:hypothetical protein